MENIHNPEHWKFVNIKHEKTEWYSLRYINNQYIMCGCDSIAYSKNMNGPWKVININKGFWTSLLYVDGYYILGCVECMIRSKNINDEWELVNAPDIFDYSILRCVNGMFMTFSKTGALYYSKKLEGQWTQTNGSVPVVKCNKYNHIHCEGGKYLISGLDQISYSDDINGPWTSIEINNEIMHIGNYWKISYVLWNDPSSESLVELKYKNNIMESIDNSLSELVDDSHTDSDTIKLTIRPQYDLNGNPLEINYVWNSLQHIGDIYIMCSRNVIAYSFDLNNWSLIKVGRENTGDDEDEFWNSILFVNNYCILSGTDKIAYCQMRDN